MWYCFCCCCCRYWFCCCYYCFTSCFWFGKMFSTSSGGDCWVCVKQLWLCWSWVQFVTIMRTCCCQSIYENNIYLSKNIIPRVSLVNLITFFIWLLLFRVTHQGSLKDWLEQRKTDKWQTSFKLEGNDCCKHNFLEFKVLKFSGIIHNRTSKCMN